MKFIFRWLFRLLIVLLVLAVAGVLLLDTFAREAAKSWVRSRTGLETKIARMDVSLFRPEVTIEGIVIYNSAAFGGSPLLEAPELHVEYERGTFFSGRWHCRLVRVNVARLNIVEDKNGRANLDAVLAHWQAAAGTNAAKKTTAVAWPRVEVLNLTLGRATYVNLKQPGHFEELKMDVRNQVLTNVASAQDFTALGTIILLKNGISPPGAANGPTNHWQYWAGRLTAAAKK